MRTFRLNKLVRDKIVQFHKDVGGTIDYRVLDEQQYVDALRQKLIEEALEMEMQKPEEWLKEIADIQEVIDAMVAALGKSKMELAQLQKDKNKKSGAFKKRHFVNTVTLPDDEYWAHYYSKDPKRFPEIKD